MRLGVWLGAVALGALGLLGPRPSAAAERAETPDAQMLLDLDLLREADLSGDRRWYQRLGLLERLRLLERMELLESETRLGPASGEVKER